MSIRHLSTVVGVSALAFVTACSAPPRRDDRVMYDPAPTARSAPAYAQYGRVENIGVVQAESHNDAAGAVIGAVVGAVVGNQFGSGSGKALATGAGAVGGAVAGNAIQNRNRQDNELYRVSVRFDNGSVQDFDFQNVGDLRIGDRVKFEGGQIYRM